MKINNVLNLIIALSLAGCNPSTESITWVSSDREMQWQVSNVSPHNSADQPDESTIIIYPEKTQQNIEGFGGCFNELGWQALNTLPAEKRIGIISEIFNPDSGCKFSICRMPIGANDFAIDWYSLNETPGDFQMEHFSIDRDKKYLVPYIKQALQFRPDLKIWGSPWCPPTWMKTNNHYACKPGEVNDLPESGQGIEENSLPVETQFRMEPKYLSAYALYFSKFVSAYRDQGIPIYAVHVQNEPNSCQVFPSCLWTPSSLATFIGDYLGPVLEKENPATEIWLGTIERPQVERIDEIIQHPEAGKYIKGVGFQWAGKGAIPGVHEKYPEMQLMQTETMCGDGSNDWAAAEFTFDLISHYFSNGANSYLYWNMVLDETGKSRWGWKQNSMITIETSSGKITYNPEFYLMKHFSHFIEPGSVKIESSDRNCLAFKDSGKIVIVYYNLEPGIVKQFTINDLDFNIPLKERSFNTFIIKRY